jgi:hypothetical protein
MIAPAPRRLNVGLPVFARAIFHHIEADIAVPFTESQWCPGGPAPTNRVRDPAGTVMFLRPSSSAASIAATILRCERGRRNYERGRLQQCPDLVDCESPTSASATKTSLGNSRVSCVVAVTPSIAAGRNPTHAPRSFRGTALGSLRQML